MCGHVGIAGKLEARDENTLKRMLIFDYFRGPDSTGFAALRNNGDTKIAKLAASPIDLFQHKPFTDALSGYNSTVFLGHNRLATKGVVTGHNAHPYEFYKPNGKKIIGAHNGTLEKKSWDALHEKLGEEFPVDSMAVIACIARFGIEETVPLLQGAWALVWIDTEDNTVNFLRNKERSFWIAYSDKFDKLFWASEYPIILAATKMAPVQYDMYTDTAGYTYFTTMENWWYRFDVDKLKAGNTERPKPRAKELKGKEPEPVVSYHYSNNNAQHPFHQTAWEKEQEAKKKLHGTTTALTTIPHSSMTSTGSKGGVASGGKKDNVYPFQVPSSQKLPFGSLVTFEQFKSFTPHGCSFCGGDIHYEDPGTYVFMGSGQVMCAHCTNDLDSRVYVA